MPSIYILKAICSFLIVFIHLPGIAFEATILQPLMRIGVPVFLMISGYFLISDKNISEAKVVKQLKKITVLTITTNGFYIALHLIRNVVLNYPTINPQWTSIGFWIRTILIGDNIDSILWYLNAYIEALLIIWCMLKLFTPEKVNRILFFMTPILLITSVLLNRYSFLIDNTFDIAVSRNAISIAIPCITLGAIANVYKDLFSKISNMTIIITVISAIAYLEYALLYIFDLNGSGADFNILTFPLAFSIFIYCILNPNLSIQPRQLHNRLIYIGKNYSSKIYLYHSLTWGIIVILGSTYDSYIIRLIMNAESIIAIILAISFLKHKLKKQRWILVKSR